VCSKAWPHNRMTVHLMSVRGFATESPFFFARRLVPIPSKRPVDLWAFKIVAASR
jgi:hypothetical protein